MPRLYASILPPDIPAHNGTSQNPPVPHRGVGIDEDDEAKFRNEIRAFRTDTRATLGQHSHRLNLIEVTVAGLKTDVGVLKADVGVLKADVGVLLSSVPDQNERLDDLEARVASLESPK
jgi:hypothetical protein